MAWGAFSKALLPGQPWMFTGIVLMSLLAFTIAVRLGSWLRAVSDDTTRYSKVFDALKPYIGGDRS